MYTLCAYFFIVCQVFHSVSSIFVLFIENEDDGEDWDREINENWNRTPVENSKSFIGVDISGVKDEKHDQFLLTLSAYPPASQAYTATATYESMACRKILHKNNNLYDRHMISHTLAIQGQFEDAE